MSTALIFALALAGLGILMLTERMGMPASLAVSGSYALMGLAAVALALLNMTSRLGRFVIGHERGAPLTATCLAATLLLTGFSLFRHSPEPSALLLLVLLGWIAGLLLAGTRPWRNFRQPPKDPADRDPLAGGSGARKLAGLALLVLVIAGALFIWERSRLLWSPVLLGSDPTQMTNLALVTGALLVLGGMAGLGRLALVAVALTLVMGLLPAAVEMLRLVPQLSETGLNLEGVKGRIALIPALLEGLASPSWTRVQAALTGLVFGAASGQALALLPARRGRVASGAIAIVLAGLLCGVMLVADWQIRAGIIETLRTTAPGQWPGFVFDPGLKGWLTTCGSQPDDPLGVALACGTGTPRTPLPVDALRFDDGLALPALAVSLGWPVLIGHVWTVLPAWLSLIGFLVLVQVVATGLSERILFRLMRPRALPSARLAYGRLAVVGLATGMALFGGQIGTMPMDFLLWVQLGAALLLAVATLVRMVEALVRRPARPGVQAPAPASPEAS
ncbi:hypothetical protein [Rhabdaerophilum sp. SD176]|uniref:hypothetical protein n=1 Tax=Rhabdaerophilum sp. SD176 TaxID=2983548 RepID=UPI0024DF4320|nr:hypothetical protein [Rhabdaerophilum sp. SD176]